MSFRTKLDYSDNRQIKQRERTSTILSGTTVFGVPFSGLTSGVDYNTTGVTETSSIDLYGTFSGNTTTTTFTWPDARMAALDTYLSALTPSNSAQTQVTEVAFAKNQTTTIDGNHVVLTYSGASFLDFEVSAMTETSSGVYTGVTLVSVDNFVIYSAGTLDYTGRTIWSDCKEISRTKKLIITDNPSAGLVWTCVDGEGLGAWSVNPYSGSGLWSASTGTNSLVPVGQLNTASGTGAIAAGGASTASGEYSFAFGPYSFATGDASVCFGNSTASGVNSVVFGNSSVVAGTSSITTGGNNNISGNNSAGFGAQIVVSGNQSFAAGSSSQAKGLASVAMGSMAVAEGSSSFAAGGSTTAKGNNSTATGSEAKAFGFGSFAGGYQTQASGFTSFAYGQTAVADADRSTVLGGYSNWIKTGATDSAIIGGTGNTLTDSANNSIILGCSDITGTTPNTVYACTIDAANILSGGTNLSSIFSSDSLWEAGAGYASIKQKGGTNVVTGQAGFTQGGGNGVSGQNSVAFGSQLTASGAYSFVLGSSITVSGDRAVCIGGNFSNARGNTSQAFGSGVTTYGDSSFAQGFSNISYGSQSFSTGAWNRVSGTTAFVSGFENTTDGDYGAILGGQSNYVEKLAINSTIIGGNNNELSATALNSSIVAGVNITGTSANTLYTNNIESTTMSGVTLNIDGVATFSNIGSNSSAGALHYDSGGVLTVNTSDVRMKSNVNTIKSALRKVQDLRGVTYNWKSDVSGDTRIGFVAQEVAEVVPELSFINQNTEDKVMGVHYQDVTALLVEAVKELSISGSSVFNREEVIINSQTVASEDNNIELNYNGTKDSALNGGVFVNKGVNNNTNSEFLIDSEGDWVTNNYIKPYGLIIPEYTPESSLDNKGGLGEMVRDNDYIYIKTSSGWKRSNLETF